MTSGPNLNLLQRPCGLDSHLSARAPRALSSRTLIQVRVDHCCCLTWLCCSVSGAVISRGLLPLWGVAPDMLPAEPEPERSSCWSTAPA